MYKTGQTFLSVGVLFTECTQRQRSGFRESKKETKVPSKKTSVSPVDNHSLVIDH